MVSETVLFLPTVHFSRNICSTSKTLLFSMHTFDTSDIDMKLCLDSRTLSKAMRSHIKSLKFIASKLFLKCCSITDLQTFLVYLKICFQFKASESKSICPLFIVNVMLFHLFPPEFFHSKNVEKLETWAKIYYDILTVCESHHAKFLDYFQCSTQRVCDPVLAQKSAGAKPHAGYRAALETFLSRANRFEEVKIPFLYLHWSGRSYILLHCPASQHQECKRMIFRKSICEISPFSFSH